MYSLNKQSVAFCTLFYSWILCFYVIRSYLWFAPFCHVNWLYWLYWLIFIAHCMSHPLYLWPDVLSNIFTGCLKYWGHCESLQSDSVSLLHQWQGGAIGKSLSGIVLVGVVVKDLQLNESSAWQAPLLSITWFALNLSYSTALFNSNDSESIYMTEGHMQPFRLQRDSQLTNKTALDVYSIPCRWWRWVWRSIQDLFIHHLRKLFLIHLHIISASVTGQGCGF